MGWLIKHEMFFNTLRLVLLVSVFVYLVHQFSFFSKRNSKASVPTVPHMSACVAYMALQLEQVQLVQ